MAAVKVDMALDDIIKAKKATVRGRGGRGGRARGARGASRGNFRSQNRGSFKPAGRGGVARGSFRGTSVRGSSGFRARGNFRGRGVSRGFSRGGALQQFTTSSVGPTKLTITNLEYGVSDSDVKELFQEFGAMRSAAIHYDSKGQSLGTAHVVFSRYSDALKAVKQYNGVHLDGRPMKITIENNQRLQGAITSAGQRGAFRGLSNTRRPVKRLSGGPVAFRGSANRGASRGRGAIRGSFRGAGARGGATRGSFRGRGGARGGMRGGRGRGGRGASNNRKPPNVADLDAELDAYASQGSK